MGLSLPFLYKGMEASYWKIISRTDDIANNSTSVTLGVYKDKFARSQNIENYLDTRTISVDGINLSFNQVYGKLKLKQQWKDAVDC